MAVDASPPTGLDRARRIGHWAARAVVAILVAYVFVVVLLAAAAQQKAADLAQDLQGFAGAAAGGLSDRSVFRPDAEPAAAPADAQTAP